MNIQGTIMKIRREERRSRPLAWWLPGFASFVVTLLALPVQAATSFPNYPLQAGLGGVPPNILFILDDSGSMDYLSMPQDQGTLSDNPEDRSYLNNTIYYDPYKDEPYRPWRTGSGTERMAGGTSITNVFADAAQLQDEESIVDSSESVFYVPKEGVTSSTDRDDFVRYFVTRLNGSIVVATTKRHSIFDRTGIGVTSRGQVDFQVDVPAAAEKLEVYTSNGSGNARLIVFNPFGQESCNRNDTNGNSESCVLEGNIGIGLRTIRIQATGNNKPISGLRLQVFVTSPVAETPTGRSQSDELTNFATWYSYHRSRMKTAKAGASEAFAELGNGYRVGFDTIWNRGGSGGNTGGNSPNFPIPVNTEAGKFEGTNRSTWFSRLQSSGADDGTPLHGALARAGRYYQTAAPWTDGSNTAELACRASFTILTTDGYWNANSGFSNADAGSGTDAEGNGITGSNADGDAYSRTLADVAMNYYRKDLRPNLANQVPTTTADRARHQHMVTFGVSIGKGGTLDPLQQPPGTWPNPWDHNAWSDGNLTQQKKRIDDLWHAAVNTKGKFIVASDSDSFANALRSALTTIQDREASGSNLSSNSQQITTNTRMYQALFNTGDWSGDLQAYAFSIVGNGLLPDPEWTLIEAVKKDTEFTNRPVLTWNNGGKRFTAANLVNSSLLERTGGLAPVSVEENIAYIKGDRSLEQASAEGNKLRDRRSPIGDIVNSSPVFVNETQTLYIGANDGMLHGLRASDGKVLFSYVPVGINFAALGNLSNPDYEHRFFVDGQLDVTTRGQGQGSNILVGALGRGGKGVFALDVTAPGSMAANDVLWDQTFQSGGDNDMGYVLGAPLVRKSNDGNTIALVPNGIESASGRAVLFVYVLGNNGGVIDALKLYGGTQTGNGLMAINAADLDANGTVDSVYGGDLQGNVWKWDFSAESRASWVNAVTGDLPLFTARDANGAVQPITGGFALAREPVTRRVFVSFGTGKFIADSDIPTENGSVQTQTLYGVIDESENISGRSQLQERTIPYVGEDSKGRPARGFERYSALPETVAGWYVDLGVPSDSARSERVVTSPTVNGRALWVSSIIPLPGQGCEPQGKGYLNALDVFTGTNPSSGGDTFTFIDVDGNHEGDDKVVDSSGTTPDGEDGFVTSVDLGVAMPGKPMVGDKAICVSGSDATSGCVPPAGPPGGTAERIMWRELIDQ
jgi:type IV pilus assembly protein PilY1